MSCIRVLSQLYKESNSLALHILCGNCLITSRESKPKGKGMYYYCYYYFHVSFFLSFISLDLSLLSSFSTLILKLILLRLWDCVVWLIVITSRLKKTSFLWCWRWVKPKSDSHPLWACLCQITLFSFESCWVFIRLD